MAKISSTWCDLFVLQANKQIMNANHNLVLERNQSMMNQFEFTARKLRYWIEQGRNKTKILKKIKKKNQKDFLIELFWFSYRIRLNEKFDCTVCVQIFYLRAFLNSLLTFCTSPFSS